MPSFSTRFLSLLCGGFLCAALGYVVGERNIRVQDTAPSPTSTPSASSNLPSSPPRARAVVTTAPSTWQTLVAAAPSPASEEKQCTFLRTLSAANPALALELAQKATSPRQRDEFTRAVLNGWASLDPLAAARWTLDHVRLGERRLAAEALLDGAIANPDAAIAAAKFLCVSDTILQSDHGNALVTAFSRAGRFDLASQFAATAPGDFRAHWLSTAFLTWAQHEPQAAVVAAYDFTDPTIRSQALQGVIIGWAASDPADLVAHADKLPAGDIRATALREGLQQWVSLDPIAASTWMDRLDPSRDLDAGAAAVATTAIIAQKKPDVAASWAESIVDPELRANTLLDFIRLWAEIDPAAARSYAANSPILPSETRASALASFDQGDVPKSFPAHPGP